MIVTDDRIYKIGVHHQAEQQEQYEYEDCNIEIGIRIGLNDKIQYVFIR